MHEKKKRIDITLLINQAYSNEQTRVRRVRLQNTIEALLIESESKFVVTKQAWVKSKRQSKNKQMVNTRQTVQKG